MVGIDDNLPGVLLTLLAAIAFVLIVITNIITDSIIQYPGTSDTLKNLIESPAKDTLGLIIAMICAAVFIVGAIGSVAMLIRSRRETT